MLRLFHPKENQLIIEIGPGLGALTHPLLDLISKLHVVELDRDLAAKLADTYPPQRLMIYQQDILSFALNSVERAYPHQQVRLIGNLPYNISTPLIFHLLEQLDQIEDMLFMVQSEVAQRLAATPGHKNYGRLSVMTSLKLDCQNLIEVPPQSFTPPPKVNSSVIKLTPKTDPVLPVCLEHFQKVVTAAFAQRRKTLRNSLNKVISKQNFDDAEINQSLRAENLTTLDFIKLSDLSNQTDI